MDNSISIDSLTGGKGMKYYSLFKSHIKMMNRM